MNHRILLIITICLLFSGYTPSYGMFARGRQAFARLSAPVAFSARNYFFGALAMRSPETKKTAILLGDHHAEIQEVSAHLQRGQVLKLIKGLLNQGESVHVLAEDMTSFLKKKGLKFHFNENKALKVNPLQGFADMCKNEGIVHTNIECRDLDELNQSETLTPELEIIKRTADPALFERLEFYWSLYNRGSNSRDSEYEKYEQSSFAEFVDAYTLASMNESNASVPLIVAGYDHIASLSKKLYRQGYMQVNSIMPEGLSAKYQSRFTDFKKNKPMKPVYGWGPLPPHLPHIDEAVLAGLKKLNEQANSNNQKMEGTS